MASAAASDHAPTSGVGADAPKETLFAEIQDKLRDECHRVSYQLLQQCSRLRTVLWRPEAPPAAIMRAAMLDCCTSGRDDEAGQC